MTDMYWGSDNLRHAAALGTSTVRGIERASGFADYDDFEGVVGRRRTAAASLFDQGVTGARHTVAGWSWDNRIEGYVADNDTADFACICGSNVAAPGHHSCTCGKIWNSYTIATREGVRLVCREVPVRENVLLASRGAYTDRCDGDLD